MALLEWDDAYLLGLEALDFEHRDLFACINALYDQCAAGGGNEELADCMGRLHSRLASHFALEEETMRQMHNPHYAEHKAEHDRFLDEVTAVIAGFGPGHEPGEADALARRVRDWIVGHITTTDRQLVERG